MRDLEALLGADEGTIFIKSGSRVIRATRTQFDKNQFNQWVEVSK